MRYTIMTFWVVYLLSLFAGLFTIVWSIATQDLFLGIIGCVLYVCAGLLANVCDWLHEYAVLHSYTKWD